MLKAQLAVANALQLLNNPRFNTRCASGAVQLPPSTDPEPELYELLNTNSEDTSPL